MKLIHEHNYEGPIGQAQNWHYGVVYVWEADDGQRSAVRVVSTFIIRLPRSANRAREEWPPETYPDDLRDMAERFDDQAEAYRVLMESARINEELRTAALN